MVYCRSLQAQQKETISLLSSWLIRRQPLRYQEGNSSSKPRNVTSTGVFLYQQEMTPRWIGRYWVLVDVCVTIRGQFVENGLLFIDVA